MHSTRKAALEAGDIHYFTGKPCKHGHIAKRYTNGGNCSGCINPEKARERTKRWRDNNRERHLAYVLAYAKANPEKVKVYKNRWTSNNKDKARASSKKSRLKNIVSVREYNFKYRVSNSNRDKISSRRRYKLDPERFRVHTRKRRAIRRKAVGSHTAQEIKDLLKRQNCRCLYCLCDIRSSYHADHLTPLSRGGTNFIDNIGLACAYCNTSKGSKTYAEFVAYRAFTQRLLHSN